MNNLVQLNTMSSREIAELTGKMHKNVVRDCIKLNEDYQELGVLKIEPTTYKDSQNKEQPMFLLSKIQVMDLMTGYSSKLRIKINRRWEELEKQESAKALPSTYLDALKQLVESTEREEKALNQLVASNHVIEENKPKVVFADSVIGSANSILVRQFAKDLCDQGFKIGQNRLFDWFRQNKYLQRNTEPYQQYVDQELFEVITRVIGSGSQTITSKTTKVTGKGVVYFTKKIKEYNK